LVQRHRLKNYFDKCFGWTAFVRPGLAEWAHDFSGMVPETSVTKRTRTKAGYGKL
jgi:hypothetical protein